MKTFAKIILISIAVLAVIEIVILAVVAHSKRVPSQTVLTLRIAGEVPEQPPETVLGGLFGARPLTVSDILEGLDRAKNDSSISGLELRVGESTMNMAKLQEVREKIREFNRAGKFSVAYLEFATNRPYYLASACGTVLLLPKSTLYVHGLMASTTFLRGTLDKLGIVPDLYQIGAYKNAMNVFTEKKFTAAHREATGALLQDWDRQFIAGLAEGRGLKVEEAAAALARGPFTSQEALAARLVDRVAYADEASELVRRKNHGNDARMNFREYLRRTKRSGRSRLAVVFATGTILPGRSGNDPLGESVMGSDTIAEQMRQAREDGSVRAVVLRIDSPGGAAYASEVIRREVELTRRAKPVVVSMSDVAASGGYWIAMSANKIVAEPGTITGSIGVFGGKFNLLGLYEKLGMTKDYIPTSENSTLDWPFKNFTPAQRDAVKRSMRDVYLSFLEGVAEGRHMKVAEVDRIAQGRVWTGAQALKLRLVDELGGLEKSVAVAKELAGIPSREQVELIFLPKPRTFFERLSELENESSFSALSPRAWLSELEAAARLPVWTLLPAVPEVQ